MVASENQTYINLCRILSINTQDRSLSIEYLGSERQKHDVAIVAPTNNYSIPEVGEIGLIVDLGMRSYYLGTIQFGYNEKINGKLNDDGSRTPLIDETSGVKIQAKEVQEGEIFFANWVKNIWLSLSNSGDFGLLSGFNEGLKYLSRDRITKLAGMTLQLVGNGAYLAFGSVIRSLPMFGNIPIPSDNPTLPAVEGVIDIFYSGLRLARLGVGHIKNILGIDEVGIFGRIRAIMEVYVGVIPAAFLKMYETGNIELKAALPTGVVSIDGGPTAGILLGGLSAVFSAVLGEKLVSYLLTHTHPTACGPSGPSTIPAPDAATLSSMILSQQTKLK